MALHFPSPEAHEAWKAAAEAAKVAGLYDKSAEHSRSFAELSSYLDGYGKSTDARVVVTLAGPRDPMEFNLSFQWLENGAWNEGMYGAAVFRSGEGWGVHT